jgi:hypothetical protein
MVHHYAYKDNLTVSLQLPTREGKHRNIKFIGGELIVSDDDDKNIALDIEASNDFKNGNIMKVSGEIKKASRKFVTVSGARGLEPKLPKE